MHTKNSYGYVRQSQKVDLFEIKKKANNKIFVIRTIHENINF